MNAWNAVAEKVIDWLVTTSWQAGVLVLLVVAAQLIFRRVLSARWSYLLWLLVVGRLLLPSLPESPTSLYRYVPASPVVRVSFPASVPRLGEPHVVQAPVEPGLVKTDDAPRVTVATPISAKDVLLAIWLIGFLALMISLIERNLRFRRLLVTSCRPAGERVRQLAGLLAREMGVTRHFEVVEAESLETPAVVGLLRTKLLLPQDFATRLSEDELNLIFRHELAHLRRGDLWMNFLVCVLQIVHWFNPVLWWAFSRMRHDRELATDALALHSKSSSRLAYGETLVKLAAGNLPRTSVNPAIGILENHRRIRQRIEQISRLKPKAYAWSAFGFVLLVALGLLALTKAPAQDRQAPVGAGVTQKSGQTGGLARGHVVDPQGKPVAGAEVMHFSYSHGDSTLYDGGVGPMIVPEATADANGDFSLPFKPGYEGIGVEIFAPGFARKKFSRLPFNDESQELRLSPGATVSGRLLKNGVPLPNREIGLAQSQAYSETYLGELTTTTDNKGRFLIKDVATDDELEVYAKRDSLGMLGVPERKLIRTGKPGSIIQAGDLAVVPGTIISGQIVLSDGKTPSLGRPVQLHVYRGTTSDYQYIDLPPDNKFQLMARDGETIVLMAWIPGYRMPNSDRQTIHVATGMKPIDALFVPDKPIPAKIDQYGRPTVSVTVIPVPPPGIKWTKITMQTQGNSPWTASSDGTKLQTQLSAGTFILRTVCRADSGQLYFSTCQNFRVTDAEVSSGQPIEVNMITTLSGFDLKGRIDASVPRPIKNGLVIACVSTGAATTEHTWLMWSKSVPVQSDGTFKIANLPPPTPALAADDDAGPLQLIVTCDGYVSKDPVAGQFEYAAGSQTFAPPIDQSLTIAMTPTGSAHVRVLDPEGKPVANALVQFLPNETFRSGSLLWYSTMLGTTWDDEKQLFGEEPPLTLKPGELMPYQRLLAKYQAVTNQDGFAEMADLPEGLVPFTVEKTAYDTPYRQRLAGSTTKYAQDAVVMVKSDSQVNTEIRLIPKITPIQVAKSTSPDGKYVISVESSRNSGAGGIGPQSVVLRDAKTGEFKSSAFLPANSQNQEDLIQSSDKLLVKWNATSSCFFFAVWHTDHYDVLGAVLSPQNDQLGLRCSNLSQGMDGKVTSCEFIDPDTLHIKVLFLGGSQTSDFYYSMNRSGQFEGSSSPPVAKA